MGLLFAPPLNMQALRPPILHGVKREGRGPLFAIRLRQNWPRVGAASPPKREPIVTLQIATYKGGRADSSIVRSSMLSIRPSVPPLFAPAADQVFPPASRRSCGVSCDSHPFRCWFEPSVGTSCPAVP